MGNMQTFSKLFILIFLVLCSVSDMKTKKISTYLLSFMSVAVALFCLILREQSVWSTVGGIGVGAFCWVVSKYTKEAIGYGDSWILLILGGYLGFRGVLELVATAFFFVGIFSLAGIVWKKWNRTMTIPFVPFLTAAYVGLVIG